MIYHGRLLRSIRAMNGNLRDLDFVEEIAARTWYLLIRDEYELLRKFDVNRGVQLITYLSTIARGQVRQFFRSECRRRNREVVAGELSGAFKVEERPPHEVISDSDFREAFLDKLTPKEKSYYTNVLTGSEDATGQNGDPRPLFSRQHGWQLKRRIKLKLSKFLEE